MINILIFAYQLAFWPNFETQLSPGHEYLVNGKAFLFLPFTYFCPSVTLFWDFTLKSRHSDASAYLCVLLSISPVVGFPERERAQKSVFSCLTREDLVHFISLAYLALICE